MCVRVRVRMCVSVLFQILSSFAASMARYLYFCGFFGKWFQDHFSRYTEVINPVASLLHCLSFKICTPTHPKSLLLSAITFYYCVLLILTVIASEVKYLSKLFQIYTGNIPAHSDYGLRTVLSFPQKCHDMGTLHIIQWIRDTEKVKIMC